MTLNFAAVPLKVTLVAPVRSVPRILTAAPTLPEFGSVSTNGPRPTDWLKTGPQPYQQAVLAPPSEGCTVKSPVCGLNQPRAGIGAVCAIKVVQLRKYATGG
jgi:hypothetical protein